MNKVILIGRLTKDLELRKTSSGISTTTFQLAVDRDFKNGNGDKETDFIQCVAWRGQADYMTTYLNKGDLIAVTGSVQTRNYDDKDGKKVYITEIQVNQVQNLTYGKKENQASEGEPSVDDLPF